MRYVFLAFLLILCIAGVAQVTVQHELIGAPGAVGRASAAESVSDGTNTSTAAQVAAAVAAGHTQGTDQGLDTGGANAVTAADVKTAVGQAGTAHGWGDHAAAGYAASASTNAGELAAIEHFGAIAMRVSEYVDSGSYLPSFANASGFFDSLYSTGVVSGGSVVLDTSQSVIFNVVRTLPSRRSVSSGSGTNADQLFANPADTNTWGTAVITAGVNPGTAENAWDNDNDVWSCTATDATGYTQVALEERRRVVPQSYGITPDSSTNNLPKAFEFLVSQNGTDWTQLDAQTGLTTGWTAGVTRTFTLSPVPSTAYRYVKVHFTEFHNGTQADIRYCRVAGSAVCLPSLVTNAMEAGTEPTRVTQLVHVANRGGAVGNTDWKAYVSKNDGATWEELTMVKVSTVTYSGGFADEVWSSGTYYPVTTGDKTVRHKLEMMQTDSPKWVDFSTWQGVWR